jgi:signal transduction histidine kinase
VNGKHGGSISVRNKETGGSVFTIRLPIKLSVENKT